MRLKGESEEGDGASMIGFNSIKVRLKENRADQQPSRRHEFQFHKGAIKSHGHVVSVVVVIGFNSIKVRLKGFPQATGRCLKTDVSIP